MKRGLGRGEPWEGKGKVCGAARVGKNQRCVKVSRLVEGNAAGIKAKVQKGKPGNHAVRTHPVIQQCPWGK